MLAKKNFSILFLAVVALTVLNSRVVAETWTIEDVAASTVLIPDTVIDSTGNIHVASGIFGKNGIKYLKRNTSGTWTTQTVDGRNVSGDRASIALDSSDNVHIAYVRTSTELGKTILAYATNASGSWVRTDISSPAYVLKGGEIAIDSSDNVYIVYSEWTEIGIDARSRFYCYTNASGPWNRQLIASATHTNMGLECSMAIDSSDNLHVSFIETHPPTGDREVRYATNKTGSWTHELIASSYTDYAKDTSIAVDSAGNVHISYYEYLDDLWESGNLRYATKVLGSWQITTVDNSGYAGSYSSIAVAAPGSVRISYYDPVNDELKYATDASGTWSTETVTNGDGPTSIALDQHYGVHIIFRQGYADLKHAYASPLTPMPPSNLTATLLPGQIHITWDDNSNNETDFVLQYEYYPTADPGWHNLAVLDPGTTSYQYGSPVYGSTYIFRVYARNSYGHSPYSNEDEVWCGMVIFSLVLDSPNGGEVWAAGSSQQITWSTNFMAPTYIDIEYSTDGANNWQSPPIATNVLASTHSYTWTVPATYSDNCILKIKDSADGRPYDISNTPFTIEPPVPMPDLIVESITTDPIQPIAGQPFNISVTVKNRGTADAGGFHIAWYKDLDSPPTPGQAADQYAWVNSLPAGSTYTMVVSDTYDIPGQYNMYARVDINGIVTESNEDNNVLGPQILRVNEFEIIEDTSTSSKWFGGDNRPGITRNVGAGQSIMLTRTSHVNSAGFRFNRRFDYSQNPDGFGHEVTLVLNVRSDNGTIVYDTEKVVPAEFDGGWVIFDLDTDLWAGQEYIFTCYLQNGEVLKYSSGILARNDDPWPESTGYSANVNTSPFDMEDWSNWSVHLWDFNFRLAGVYTDRSRADFNANGIVDLLDLRTLANNWLRINCQMPDWCEQTDLDWSNTVQFTDFAVFAHHYLRYEGGYDYWVDALHGSDSNPGTWDAPFKTISLALSAAGENKLIKVLPGTYDETLGETFPLMLQPGQILIGDEENKGDGPTPTLIVGYGDFEAGTFKYATMVGAEDSKVSGFKIGTNTKIHLHFAIVADGVTVQIPDNTFKANTYGGVMLSNEGTSVIEDNVFDTDSYGIYLRSCMDGPTIQRNAFLSMSIPINGSDCSVDTLISENTITGNGQVGIQFAGDAQIDKNTFNRPDGYTYGAIRCSSGNPAIRRNIFICTEAVRIDGGNPDLGTASEHGNNDFSSVTGASVTHNGTATVYAIGNTWPNFPPLFGTDILLNSTGDVIWWEELGSGTVTIAEGTGYDFSTGTSGGLSHGDFYYLYQSEEIKFWANNAGQRGLQDVGLYDDSLNRVQIPTSGYRRFGVPAIAGHMYVSLAEEGEEGCYIIFKVNSADETQVNLTYIYVYAVP